MVVVCVGEHGIVHVSQIQPKLLSVLRKQPGLPRIQQDLLFLILYIEAQAPLAREAACFPILSTNTDALISVTSALQIFVRFLSALKINKPVNGVENIRKVLSRRRIDIAAQDLLLFLPV